jgi:hypothetical protein
MQLNNPETKDFYIRRGIQQGIALAGPDDLADVFDDYQGATPLTPSWREDILRKVYSALLFDSYKTGDLAKTQYYWKKTVQSDPSWLKNRGIWSIGLKALLSRGE